MGTECPHLARVSNARPRKRSSLAESNRVRSFDISRAQAQGVQFYVNKSVFTAK
jgi:hypothetical protein